MQHIVYERRRYTIGIGENEYNLIYQLIPYTYKFIQLCILLWWYEAKEEEDTSKTTCSELYMLHGKILEYFLHIRTW